MANCEYTVKKQQIITRPEFVPPLDLDKMDKDRILIKDKAKRSSLLPNPGKDYSHGDTTKPMFPPLPKSTARSPGLGLNEFDMLNEALGEKDTAASMVRAASSSGGETSHSSADATPRSRQGYTPPNCILSPSQGGLLADRNFDSPDSTPERPKTSASGKVFISEQAEFRANPEPVIAEEAEQLLEEYLSPRKLRMLTGMDDLEKVTFLEMKVDSREMSLGNFGMYLPNLTQLKLSNSIIRTIRDLGSRLGNLRVLWMSQCGLQELDGIGSMSSLIELYLSYNELSDLSPCTMLENLEILDVEGNNVNEIDQVQFLAMCTCLKCLTLDNNPVCLSASLTKEYPTYNYRERIRALLPNLEVLDDEPIDQPCPSPNTLKQVNTIFEEDWKLLEELEEEGMAPGAEETVQLNSTLRYLWKLKQRKPTEVPIQPGTSGRPITSYRPGSALRPYSTGTIRTPRPNSVREGMSSRSSPGGRPASARPGTSTSGNTEDEEINVVEDASDLTRGALLSGNLARALKKHRATFEPTSLKDCPQLLEELQHLRARGLLPTPLPGDDDSYTQLFSEVEMFKQEHSKTIDQIVASKAPQILQIDHEEPFEDSASELSDDSEHGDCHKELNEGIDTKINLSAEEIFLKEDLLQNRYARARKLFEIKEKEHMAELEATKNISAQLQKTEFSFTQLRSNVRAMSPSRTAAPIKLNPVKVRGAINTSSIHPQVPIAPVVSPPNTRLRRGPLANVPLLPKKPSAVSSQQN